LVNYCDQFTSKGFDHGSMIDSGEGRDPVQPVMYSAENEAKAA
jgi:hypothetical protein